MKNKLKALAQGFLISIMTLAVPVVGTAGLMGVAGCSKTTVTPAQVIAALQKVNAYLPTVKVAVSGLMALTTAFLPQDQILIQKYGTEVNTDITTLQAQIVSATTVNAPTILALVQQYLGQWGSNMNAILAAAHISNPQTVAEVNAAITAIQLAIVIAMTYITPVMTAPAAVAMIHEAKIDVASLEQRADTYQHPMVVAALNDYNSTNGTHLSEKQMWNELYFAGI